ncbi:CocE/NonD family hydrolase [Crocosphaera sp. UHCC 0190]|uniref:CocE/NonD family hydrolase n=1 Tax=Crocosphaera sp. UHCC 0190 TaxID=3110246 RepID=UPI002B21C996|nr:CocE/NonD family hydrolase [Crocosphaera sp. UHCC 0190]MEA5508462.1 CocE/NonD family hydrolase [Crocosphaera sp. UHCC 0190]
MFQIKQETLSLITRDGIRLDSDIYRPQSSEPFPVLLMRQPYGRKIASTVVYAHPAWYAAQGYIVVIQDVRGRGTSQGEFELFADEIEDGLDTINWVSQLPGSTGNVGMYGFSYQGMTQLSAASTKPKALKTICPAMIAYDLYSDWGYENGAFCLQTNLGWAIQLAAETARLQGDTIAFQKLYAASHNLPLYDPIPAYPNLLKEVAPDSFYHDWLNHPYPDDYWAKLSPKTFIDKLDLPMLHIGGWFDPYLRGTLNLYKAMKTRSKLLQHLIIGPWGHLPWSPQVGSINYTKSAISFIDQYQINWFNYFLKYQDNSPLNFDSVLLFEMGSDKWRTLDNFPINNYHYYYLFSQGLASIREDDGQLSDNVPKAISMDIIVHDPWRPVPSLGGHASIPSGSFDRSSVDSRSDVLTYTSQPLTEDLEIIGEPFLEIYCIADAPSFDICAVLSEVFPDGKVDNFSQGYMRVDSDELPHKIALQATCMRISKGNCLRLSLSGACFPAYSLNTGTGKLPKEERLIEAKIITLTVTSRPDKPSKISLPISS